MRRRRRNILPGYGLSVGLSLTYLSAIVLIPLAAAVLKTSRMSWGEFWRTVGEPRAVHAVWVSVGCSFAAAVFNGFAGLLVAWVLTRYRFFGRRVLDAIVDFPFALPTAVAGLTFADLFASNENRVGWMARWWNPAADGMTHGVNGVLGVLGVSKDWMLLPDSLHAVYTPFAIIVVLVFTGLPFVIRTVQPVLEELHAEPELEEAAATLGASRWQTFRRVILPTVFPAWLTGVSLAFARGVGEYGSVVFVSGNARMRSEIVPILIVEELSQFNYARATALAIELMVISFVILLVINGTSAWSRRWE